MPMLFFFVQNKISRLTNRSIWSDAMRCIWSDDVRLCKNKISRFTNRSPFVIITHRIITGSHKHTHIRRVRSVCNHHSKILQHHRIIAGSHTYSHTHTHIRRMRSVCNHHSKILQHHRIITRSHTLPGPFPLLPTRPASEGPG